MSLFKVCIFAVLIGLAGAPARSQTFQSLYSFPQDGLKGKQPVAALTVGPDGDLYGTATAGGAVDAGTAFKVSLANGAVTVIGEFDGETTGLLPYARLLNIGNGYLYGVSEQSSESTVTFGGTVYRLDPAGGLSQVAQLPTEQSDPEISVPSNPRALVSGQANTLQVLCADYPGLWRVPLDGPAPEVAYTFAADSIDGGHARTIIRGSDGLLYGTTIGSSEAGDAPRGRGTIFRIDPDGTGMTTLHDCQYTTGSQPYGALVEAPDGKFYGVMRGGAKGGAGCVFSITPDGEYKVLFQFGLVTDDLRHPYGGLLLASDGQLYGTTRYGGSSGLGGIFRIKTNGTGYKVLHTFNGTNGANPEGGLVQAVDGNLYGTTTFGGTETSATFEGNGTIFRIKLNLPAPPANRPPVAVSDVAVSTGNAVVINVTANDYDLDGDALTVAILNGPSAGTAVVQSNGSILYTPSNTYPGTDSFTYTVSDGRGGVTPATVRIQSTTPQPGALKGIYNGLLILDPELNGNGTVPRAQFLLSVSENQSFTGILLTQRKRVSFRGSFNSKGFAVVNLKLPDKRAAALFLSLQAGTPNMIVGALFGPELWSGAAGQLKASDSSTKESYTVLLEGNSDVAAGHGFGLMRTLPSGLVSVVGKLGDGSKLSWGSTFIGLPDNVTAIPVFSEPMKDGVCGGLLKREIGTERDFGGFVSWVRPRATKRNKPYLDGFGGIVDVTVGRFAPTSSAATVLDLVDGEVTLSDGPFSDSGPIKGTFTLGGKKIATEEQLRSLAIDRKTGLFIGKMQAGRKPVTFMGVVNQAQNFGAGQFSIGGETGAVFLGAPRVPAIR